MYITSALHQKYNVYLNVVYNVFRRKEVKIFHFFDSRLKYLLIVLQRYSVFVDSLYHCKYLSITQIVTKLLRMSSIAFVKANRADLDDMPYSVESHLGVFVCR